MPVNLQHAISVKPHIGFDDANLKIKHDILTVTEILNENDVVTSMQPEKLTDSKTSANSRAVC